MPVDHVHRLRVHDRVERSEPEVAGRDWRRRKECGGGVPFDLDCYCVDACNRLAGAPV